MKRLQHYRWAFILAFFGFLALAALVVWIGRLSQRGFSTMSLDLPYLDLPALDIRRENIVALRPVTPDPRRAEHDYRDLEKQWHAELARGNSFSAQATELYRKAHDRYVAAQNIYEQMQATGYRRGL